MKKESYNQQALIKAIFNPTFSFIFISLNLFMAGLFLFGNNAQALIMSNDGYRIHFGNLNMAGGVGTNSQYKLGVTVGQIAPGRYTGTNYIARIGFQYITSRKPFTFAISSLFIDFGPLAPGTPVTRTNELTVTKGSTYKYQVLASENHPLRIEANSIDIPDTTCDNGTCSETTPSPWTSVLTYGFGYRCDNLTGDDCNSSFTTATNYGQFANEQSAETAQAIMQSNSNGKIRKAQITYKANISAAQSAGEYKNMITFIAVPSI